MDFAGAAKNGTVRRCVFQSPKSPRVWKLKLHTNPEKLRLLKADRVSDQP
jgi:hypothetical protein